MSLHILDTDTLSLLRRNHPVVLQRVNAMPPGEVAITVLTAEEQLTGRFAVLRKAKRPDEIALAYRRLTITIQGLTILPILSFTEPAVHRFRTLLAMKLNVGRMDLRIAATALECGAVVVTRNLRDFGRVPNLTVQDWTV